MKLRLGVIFGGESVEHEVSIISAVQAMKNLDEEKYEIIPIYIGKDREWYTGRLLKDIEVFSDLDLLKRYSTNVILSNKGDKFVLIKKKGIRRIIDYIDLVLPVVHGTNVEDGTLQGYLELLGIPYVGSNVYSTAKSSATMMATSVVSIIYAMLMPPTNPAEPPDTWTF